MLEPFIIRALFAGLGIALLAGPLGCLLVWRKMAYFGDSLAHSALLGIALGVVYSFSQEIGIIIVCTAFAVLLLFLQYRGKLATDTLLGILAHAALSLGMIVLSVLDTPQLDIHSYLFGDILTVQSSDLLWIYCSVLAIMLVVRLNWSQLVLVVMSEDLARAEGIKVLVMNTLFMAMMTVVVAVSLQIVGILLITSLLLIPSAAAREWSKTPNQMVFLATSIGMLAVIGGILASLYYDIPTGPSIVATATLGFVLLLISSIVTKSYQKKFKRLTKQK